MECALVHTSLAHTTSKLARLLYVVPNTSEHGGTPKLLPSPLTPMLHSAIKFPCWAKGYPAPPQVYIEPCKAPILQPLSPSYRPDNYLRPQLQKWFHHSSLLFPAPSVLIAHTTATSASPPCFSTPRSQTLSPSPRRYFLRHSCSTGCSLASVSWICDSIRRHHNEKSSHH